MSEAATDRVNDARSGRGAGQRPIASMTPTAVVSEAATDRVNDAGHTRSSVKGPDNRGWSPARSGGDATRAGRRG